jgi:dipeptidase E
MKPSRTGGTIVAIGGSEFSMRPENEALHDYVLSHVAGDRPRICLLPTAAGDQRDQIRAFHAAMERRNCRASSLSLFRLGESEVDVAAHLLGQDVIYVAGGNMVNLIALWREHGIAPILREAYARGVVLCGYSAGSMCWFEHGLSRGVGRPVPTRGLGLIAGSHCVHYSQDPPRRSEYRRLVGLGELPAGLALDDHSAALIVGGELREAVASRSGASAYEVSTDGSGGGTESRIETRLLEPTAKAPESALEEMRELRRLRERHGA